MSDSESCCHSLSNSKNHREAAVAVKPLEELYKFVPLPLDQRTATYGGIWQEAFNKYFQNLSLPNQDTVLNALSSISDGAQLVARWRAYLNHLKGKEREWAWLKSIDSDAVQSYLLPELHENFETLPLSLRYQQDYCSYAEAREEVNSAYIKLSSTRILNRSIVFIYPPDINKPLKRLVLEWLRTTYELSLREGKLQQIQEFLGGFTGDLLKLKEDRRYATDRFVKTETKNKISKLDDEKLRLEGLLTELRGTVATYKLYLDKVLKREKNDLKLQFKLATPFEELINRIKSEAKIESDSLNAALTKLINLAYPEIKRATFDTAAIEEELKTAKEKKEAAELEQQPIHEQKVADPDRREESESPAISTKNLRLSESGPAHSPQQLDSLSPPSESSNSNSGQTRCPPPAWAPPPDPRVSIQFNGKPYEAGDCVEFNPNSPLWNRDLTLAVKGTCEFNGVHGYWVLDGKGEACFVPVEDVSHCAERIDFS